jgi:threonine synthase
MDIQVSSNFERLLFDLFGRDGDATAAAMQGFEREGRLALTPAQRSEAGAIFLAERVDEAGMMQAIGRALEGSGQLLDPHSAIGYAAARARAAELAGPIVTLATAHPAKFPDAVERASGNRPPLPRRVQHLFDREERFVSLAADLAVLKRHIEASA